MQSTLKIKQLERCGFRENRSAGTLSSAVNGLTACFLNHVQYKYPHNC